MLKSYLRTAVRSLRRHAGYALVNLVGLAIGIACFLLVVLYVRYEYSFDDYHENADRLYRLVSYGGFGEKSWGGWIVGDPIEEMREIDPEVEDATKYTHCGAGRIQHEGVAFRDIRMLCAESNLFNLFTFDLWRGDPATVLDRPNTAVITRTLAQRIFGDENPLGRSLPIHFVNDERLFEITGLMEDVRTNTFLTFDVLLSYESLKDTDRCLTCGNPMYALLAPGADTAAVASRVLSQIRAQGKEYVEAVRLEPIREIHFSTVPAERQGDRRYVYLLSTIAFVILLIACANYMNLAIARSIRRTREVGVRKVVGAGRGQLVRQFLTETLVLTILAVPFSLLLLVVALPLFNELAGTDVGHSWGGDVWMIGTVLAVVVLVGLLAGCYPALFLSRFHPVEVLHGRTSVGSSGAVLRRMLVVFQFVASIVLIVGTVVVLRQIDYVQHKKLGFDAEQILLIHLTDPLLSQQHEMLKQEFQRLPNVTGATAGWGMPGQRGFHGSSYIDKPFGEDGPPVTLARPPIDSDFLMILDIPLLAGRNISDTVPESGTLEAIVNESAVDAMGWRGPGDALGKEFGGVTVVGVVADFHFRSLHEKIEPLMMTQNQFGRAGVVALRVTGGDIAGSLRALEKEWKATGTSMPFEFSFLTDELDLLYEREQRTAKIFGIFAGLAILIAILGLIGLAAFSAARRTKEIGIRKVLGAGVLSIIGLLTREFLWLVAAAFIIAAPVAYVAAQRWLETFAYRVELSWPLFVGVGLAALVFALTAVCSQAVRAALADPVNSLRYE